MVGPISHSFRHPCNQWASYCWLFVASEKAIFLGRILTLPEVPKVVLDILKLRLNMLNVDSDSNSIGFLSEILHSLETYNLMPYLHLWQRVSIFPSYRKWKHIVNSRIFSHERADIFTASEAKPVVSLTLAAFTNYPPTNFWSPDTSSGQCRPKRECSLVTGNQ